MERTEFIVVVSGLGIALGIAVAGLIMFLMGYRAPAVEPPPEVAPVHLFEHWPYHFYRVEDGPNTCYYLASEAGSDRGAVALTCVREAFR